KIKKYRKFWGYFIYKKFWGETHKKKVSKPLVGILGELGRKQKAIGSKKIKDNWLLQDKRQ
ncbi:hypothetical protein ACEE78_12015, partial [Staphylococcus hyicus]